MCGVADAVVSGYKAIESLRAALAAPEDKPVAWMNESQRVAFTQFDIDGFDDATRLKYSIPLYTHPQAKPLLSDAEIIEIAKESKTAEGGLNGYILPISFAREIEAKVRS